MTTTIETLGAVLARQMIVNDPQRKLLAEFGPDQQVEVVTEVTPFGNFTLSITPIN